MPIFKYRESSDSPWKKLSVKFSALASDIMTKSGKSVQQELDSIDVDITSEKVVNALGYTQQKNLIWVGRLTNPMLCLSKKSKPAQI